MRILKTAAIIFFLSPCVAPAWAEGRLTVIGEGSIETQPDMATISLGVTTEAETAAEALSANNEMTASVLETVSAAQVEPRDIQTSGLSLSPNWSQDRDGEASRIVGFVASNQITVRVRDLEALGGILDDVVSGGANTFNGLTFGLQEPGPARDEARKEAVADAQRKAQLYAEAAGVTLGPIVELSEVTGDQPQPMYRSNGAMMESAVPIAQGEISIEASVTVVFEIAE